MTESEGGSAASGTAAAVATESASGPSTASAETNMMDNIEEVLMELNKFEKRTDESAAIPQLLEEYLRLVAKTGSTFFPWPKVKPLIKAKVEAVITEFYTSHPTEDIPPVPNVDPFSFASCKSKLLQQLDYFGGIPFSVQRLCELLITPRKHYKRTDKFMRALEKNMLIVSTVDSRSKHKVEESSAEEKVDDPLRPSGCGIRMMNGSANGEERISAASDSFKVRAGVKRRLSDDADDADDEDDDEPDAKGLKGEKQKPAAGAASPAQVKEDENDEQEPEEKPESDKPESNKPESDDRLKAEEAKGELLW